MRFYILWRRVCQAWFLHSWDTDRLKLIMEARALGGLVRVTEGIQGKDVYRTTGEERKAAS